MELGCAEFCLPDSFEEKLEACIRHGLWLELANQGERDLSLLESYEVDVRTVQAYNLHRFSLIGKSRDERRAAMRHVKNTISLASEVGADYALIVPGYSGHRDIVDAPEERFRKILEDLASYASERGITILVEALGPRRTAFLPSLTRLKTFLDSLNLDNIALAGDTCNAFEAGEDVVDFRTSIVELHLKDEDAKPPGKGRIDFRRVLTHSWNQLCIEYKGNGREFEAALRFLRSLI